MYVDAQVCVQESVDWSSLFAIPIRMLTCRYDELCIYKGIHMYMYMPEGMRGCMYICDMCISLHVCYLCINTCTHACKSMYI